MDAETRKILKDGVDVILAYEQERDVLKNTINENIDAILEKVKGKTDIDKGKFKAIVGLFRRNNLNELKSKVDDLEILYDDILGVNSPTP